MEHQSRNAVPDERYTAENRQAEDYISAGDLPSAAGILVKVVESDPENWRAFNNMGIISWMREAWEDAFTMFKKAVTLRADYADALANLYDAALKLGRAHEVLPLFKRAVEADDSLEEIRILGESIETQGEDVYTSERALQIGRYHPQIDKANGLLEEGKINEAMKVFLEIHDTEGPSAEVFCGLGIVSYYQQRYQDAVSCFVESIKLNPTKKDTFLNLMDAARMCDKVNEAIQIYETCLKEFPSLEEISEQMSEK